MTAAVFGPSLIALIGILLGGGLKNWSDWANRRAEARAIEAAIVSEIRALVLAVRNRGIRWTLTQCLFEAERTIRTGKPSGNYWFPKYLPHTITLRSLTR